jgi:hypothetical protein
MMSMRNQPAPPRSLSPEFEIAWKGGQGMSTSLLWRPLDIVDSEENFADLRMSLSNCWT